jgi:acetyl esterase/lipase
MPNQLYDVKAAVRFLRANAARHFIDPNRVALAGDSAGAHLSDLAALTADDPAFEDPDRLYSDVSCKVRAAISWFAITDLSGEMSELLGWFYGADSAGLTVDDIARLSRLCSPIFNVPENAAPPFYIQHGLIDSETPYTQSCDLYNALMTRSPNLLHRLELLPGMEHAVAWFISRENAEHILDWLDEALGRMGE